MDELVCGNHSVFYTILLIIAFVIAVNVGFYTYYVQTRREHFFMCPKCHHIFYAGLESCKKCKTNLETMEIPQDFHILRNRTLRKWYLNYNCTFLPSISLILVSLLLLCSIAWVWGFITILSAGTISIIIFAVQLDRNFDGELKAWARERLGLEYVFRLLSIIKHL